MASPFVFELGAIANPIGREDLHQVDHWVSAKVLFYALTNLPNIDWYSLFSTAQMTMGGMKEGNNGNVVGNTSILLTETRE